MIAEVVEVAVREFYERCSAVAVSSQAIELALRNRGYRIQSFEVMKNGVDAYLFDPAKRDEDLRERIGGGRKLLLYVGRLSREKGLERLAAGYSDLKRRRDDAHLVIVGDGLYRRELEAALGDDATFTGFLRGEELARLFASSDVFLFPSTTDTLGRAVVEAQASGLPAVVYAVGGPKECILPGTSGFAVSSGEEEFFGRVELLLDDAWLREQMGQAARRFAEPLDWQAVSDGLTALYSRLIDPERPTHASL
jgi:glycosyltransferase involved in cell wall biosynthesis